MPRDRRPDKVEIEELEKQLARASNGDVTPLSQAVATYEIRLASAHESGESNRYRGISREYQAQLITVLDDATQTEGWGLLKGFLDAYHPNTTEDFPHVTTVLQNVTGRYLIRTRLSEDINEIPVAALEFFSSILDQIDGDGYDFINEGLHPYGWGIGHPDHAVADNIHQHASTNIFVVNPMLEHAFYADQHSAMDLLEQIVRDDSIDRSLPHTTGQISETRYLLDAPAGAVSDFEPTIPRYWDWQKELDYEFELDEDVERRIRDIVTERNIESDLPDDWGIADLII